MRKAPTYAPGQRAYVPVLMPPAGSVTTRPLPRMARVMLRVLAAGPVQLNDTVHWSVWPATGATLPMVQDVP